MKDSMMSCSDMSLKVHVKEPNSCAKNIGALKIRCITIHQIHSPPNLCFYQIHDPSKPNIILDRNGDSTYHEFDGMNVVISISSIYSWSMAYLPNL